MSSAQYNPKMEIFFTFNVNLIMVKCFFYIIQNLINIFFIITFHQCQQIISVVLCRKKNNSKFSILSLFNLLRCKDNRLKTASQGICCSIVCNIDRYEPLVHHLNSVTRYTICRGDQKHD